MQLVFYKIKQTCISLLITSVLLPLFLFRLGVTLRLLALLLHALRGIGGGLHAAVLVLAQ
jgi:hypothetical protein